MAGSNVDPALFVCAEHVRQPGGESPFDNLMGRIAKRVSDKRLLKLIRAFLRAGVMEGGLVSPVRPVCGGRQ
jgi:hypothetical protein